MTEEIIDPEVPIIDPHHHLWFRPESLLKHIDKETGLLWQALVPTLRKRARYLLDEFLADATSGHNVRASVFMEARSMYRATGPQELISLGEVEFANGIGAITASNDMTDVRACAGIVSGGVDLRMGDAAREILEIHMRAGGDRYRGIRGHAVIWDEDPNIIGSSNGIPHVLLDSKFREGFRHLAALDLSFDCYLTEYQLPELLDLARAFPDTQIIVNHTGGLFGVGRYEGRTEERFAAWRENIAALAGCPQVTMKLGGLGMPTSGQPWTRRDGPSSSQELANEWRPYLEGCIEAFGADRCMFESNFPVDAGAGSYAVVWNAFKHVARGASADEKAALFAGTAARVYRIEL